MSWLTLLNDNGQSFPDAELLVVAGTLKVVSNFEALADPPDARPLALTCYPFGSTAAGSPIGTPAPLESNLNRLPQMAEGAIVVTGMRAQRADYNSTTPMVTIGEMAVEEALGDLKLYRVPVPVTVAAKGLKQVAFLDQQAVEGRLLYAHTCGPWDETDEAQPAGMLLATVNDEKHGLGKALPMGGVAVFEPSAFGEQLVAEEQIRDYAKGQDVELDLGESRQVFGLCELPGDVEPSRQPARWTPMRTTLSNANPNPVTVRIYLGHPSDLRFRGLHGTRLKDGQTIVEVTVPANGQREVTWEVRPAGAI
jgi:hypothetical protein